MGLEGRQERGTTVPSRQHLKPDHARASPPKDKTPGEIIAMTDTMSSETFSFIHKAKKLNSGCIRLRELWIDTSRRSNKIGAILEIDQYFIVQQKGLLGRLAPRLPRKDRFSHRRRGELNSRELRSNTFLQSSPFPVAEPAIIGPFTLSFPKKEWVVHHGRMVTHPSSLIKAAGDSQT